MDPLCEERVEAKFRQEATRAKMLFLGLLALDFVLFSIGAAFIDHPTKFVIGVWFMGAGVLYTGVAVWAGVDLSINTLRANGYRFAREAREEIAAEVKRAEEARQSQE